MGELSDPRPTEVAPIGGQGMAQKNAKADAVQVWVSDSYFNTLIYRRLRAVFGDEPTVKEDPEDLDWRAQVYERYTGAMPQEDTELPKLFVGQFPHIRFNKPLPDFFVANGYYVASERFANVLRSFDIGVGRLIPVPIFQGNCKDLVPGTFFLLQFGCRKTCFLPEHSNERFTSRGRTATIPEKWGLLGDLRDDYCALSPEALVGSDLWFDTRVGELFFLSGRLIDALRAAKVTRTLRLRQCRIVANQVEA